MRVYMVAALLMANRGGSGSSGGTHSGGGTGPSTAVGAGGSGTGTGGSFYPDGTENATRTSRNGRGATTQTTPTRYDEAAQTGRRKGRGSCRNCCDACEGNVPATWTVTIPGTAGAVVLQRVTNSFGSAYCIWEWNGRQTSGCAGSPWMGRVELQIYVAATVDGPKYDQVLRVYPDPEGSAMWSWTNRNETQPHDCLVAMDPTWSGGTCADPGDPTVTPGDRSKCCPCTICCSACGDDYTPASWNVTIDGQRYNVPRALDDDTDVSNVATCVWRKAINQDVCDLAAKWIEIRVINDTNVGAAFPYYLECELIEADETSHTLWRKSTAMALACGAASHELTKVSGECAGNVTVYAVGINTCLEGSGVCPWCDEGTAPAQLQIEVSGLANRATDPQCTDCNSLNGTYILDQSNIPNAYSACEFVAIVDPPVCDIVSIHAFIFGGCIYVYFSCDGTSGVFGRKKCGLGSPHDCEYDGLETDTQHGVFAGCPLTTDCTAASLVYSITAL